MLGQNKMNQFLENSLPFFNQLTPSQKELLISKSKLQSYSKNIFLNYDGPECLGIIMVISGQIRAFINSADGKEITLYRLQASENCILSASCMFKNLTFNIVLQIEKDSEILVIPTNVYEKLSEENIFVKSYSLDMVSSRFSDVMWILEQLVFSNVGKRLADSLIQQSTYANNLIFKITHDDIARDIGTAREVVTRLLKQFQLDNIVKLSRAKIEILNLEKLHSFS